jgi:hypothetical protein
LNIADSLLVNLFTNYEEIISIKSISIKNSVMC